MTWDWLKSPLPSEENAKDSGSCYLYKNMLYYILHTFYMFITANKSHQKTPSKDWSKMLLPNCCPKTLTNIYEPHRWTETYMSLHNYEHLFWVIPHKPSWYWKYSLDQQMYIHPLLKIVPNKYTISSCLSNICRNLQSAVWKLLCGICWHLETSRITVDLSLNEV